MIKCIGYAKVGGRVNTHKEKRVTGRKQVDWANPNKVHINRYKCTTRHSGTRNGSHAF